MNMTQSPMAIGPKGLNIGVLGAWVVEFSCLRVKR